MRSIRQDQHCRLHRMGHDFYVMALESHIGTLVDGQLLGRGIPGRAFPTEGVIIDIPPIVIMAGGPFNIGLFAAS